MRQSCGDTAGQRDMVFLDQYAIVKSHALIFTAPGFHRIFLRGAQTRQGFARVHDFRPRAVNRIDKAPRCSRCRRQRLQEVQRWALGGQHCARVTIDAAKRLARIDLRAITRAPCDPRIGIECPEAGFEPRGSAQYRARPANQFGVRAIGLRNQRRGQIAAADVFIERRADVARDFRGEVHQQCAGNSVSAARIAAGR